MTDAGLACRLALGGVVTTVDAVTGAATLIREDISVKQVALADRLVLTKTDLVDTPADRAAAPPDLIGRLRSLNATAPLLQACHGEIDPECLFDSSLDDPLANAVPANSVLARPIGQGPFPSPSSGRVDARSAAGWGFLRLLFSKSPAFKKPHPARESAPPSPKTGRDKRPHRSVAPNNDHLYFSGFHHRLENKISCYSSILAVPQSKTRVTGSPAIVGDDTPVEAIISGRPPGSTPAPAEHAHTPQHDHPHHGIDTYAILRAEPIRAVALTLFLEALAEHCGADLLRLKGIVHILESPDRPAVIHGVQHVFHPPSWLPRWPSDDRRSRIVFITRGIRRAWVETLLDALDAEVAEVSAGR